MKKKLTTMLLLVILGLQAFSQTTGTVTDVSGNTYGTVKIGTQWWMSENLKAEKLNDGTHIPYVSFPEYAVWANLSTPGRCWMNDSFYLRNIYGELYNWYTVATDKICPIGWHVPGENDWVQLANYLGGMNVAGGKMKEAGTTHWLNPNNGATNESGFTALPGGERSDLGMYHPATTYGKWWSADANADTTKSQYMTIRNSFPFMMLGSDYKKMGFSIRCVEDISVTGVTVSPTSLSLPIGDTSVLTASILPLNATNQKVSWTSSNTSVATVSDFGVVTAVAPGLATITGTTLEGNKIANSAVTVTARTITDVSGNTYRTVQIGTHWWMAENLKVDKLNDGTPIPYINRNDEWINLSTPGYSWMYNSLKYRDIYGGLYNWHTVVTDKICPIGWHVPGENEWSQLADYLDGIDVAGGKMKDTLHWQLPNKGATNESGFTGLPGGERKFTGRFGWIKVIGKWWSADAHYANRAKYMKLQHASTKMKLCVAKKTSGFSIRCSEDIPVTGVALSHTSLSLITDSVYSFIATVSPSDATNQKVGWASSDTNIATVSDLGVVTAVASGVATITVTTLDGNKTASCKVTVRTYGRVTDVLGNTYRTVKIGSQWWMAENMKADKLTDGTPISYVSSNSEWSKLSTPGYCWLNDSANNRDIYGGLYNWDVIKTGKVCPLGWHVPSYKEWIKLRDYLGGTRKAGGKMKEEGTAHWSAPNRSATNESGFNALPGYRNIDGSFISPLNLGGWWSTDTAGLPNRISCMRLFSHSGTALITPDYMQMGFPVRCIEDTVPYCELKANSSDMAWINKVVLNTINNTSGNNGGYSDFTAISTDLAIGKTYQLEIYPQRPKHKHILPRHMHIRPKFYDVWIDYNNDKDFDDAGEHIIDTLKKCDFTSFQISVPPTALPCKTMMRIAMSDKHSTGSCGTFSSGEVEDYTVNITLPLKSAVTVHADTLMVQPETIDPEMAVSVYPNPASNKLLVNVIGTGKINMVSVVGISGKRFTVNFDVNDKSIDVSSLPKGMYIVIINTEKGEYKSKFIKQ
jgi:uncharacterized protein (TIGR02145 family)